MHLAATKDSVRRTIKTGFNAKAGRGENGSRIDRADLVACHVAKLQDRGFDPFKRRGYREYLNARNDSPRNLEARD